MSAPDLTANKTLVVKALTGLFNDRDFSLLDKIFAPNYIQHNPTIGNGTASLKALAPILSPNLHYTPAWPSPKGTTL